MVRILDKVRQKIENVKRMRDRRSLRELDMAHLLHPFTDLEMHQKIGPFVLSHGEGCHLYTDDGKQYLDGFGALWCNTLGYSEHRVIQAAVRQFEKLPFFHIFTGRTHEPAIRLAQKLVELRPSPSRDKPLTRVFLCNSGSEANDTAMKLVWSYNNALGRTQKKKIIARDRAYHGVGIGSGSLSKFPHVNPNFDLPIDLVKHTDCPDYARNALPNESEEQFSTRMADNLEKLILAEGGADAVAAMFAEPIMGVGGVLIPPRTYWDKITKVLKKYDMLLIADEVVTGFCRTGHMFGSQTVGIEPDMMVMAKGLGAGYMPIAAVMLTEDIHAKMVSQSTKHGMFGHGYTYSGHPVACAVALEVIRVYEEDHLLDRVRKLHPLLKRRLEALRGHPLVGDVRVVGLLAGVDIVRSKKPMTFFDKGSWGASHVFKKCLEHGVILRYLGETVAFCPPLIITEDQINTLCDTFAKALDEVHAEFKLQGLL